MPKFTISAALERQAALLHLPFQPLALQCALLPKSGRPAGRRRDFGWSGLLALPAKIALLLVEVACLALLKLAQIDALAALDGLEHALFAQIQWLAALAKLPLVLLQLEPARRLAMRLFRRNRAGRGCGPDYQQQARPKPQPGRGTLRQCTMAVHRPPNSAPTCALDGRPSGGPRTPDLRK